MDGLYATMTAQHPYLDEATQQIRFWANKYKTRFNEEPSVMAAYGYIAGDTFIRAAQKAGPHLTTDSFVKAMDSLTVPRDIFGSAEGTYSPTKHLGKSLFAPVPDPGRPLEGGIRLRGLQRPQDGPAERWTLPGRFRILQRLSARCWPESRE